MAWLHCSLYLTINMVYFSWSGGCMFRYIYLPHDTQNNFLWLFFKFIQCAQRKKECVVSSKITLCKGTWFMGHSCSENVRETWSVKQVTLANKFHCHLHVLSYKNGYRKVVRNRPVYSSILNFSGKRSQYISIKFPLHKQSENAWALIKIFDVKSRAGARLGL